jgi:predicted P-loop ATPase
MANNSGHTPTLDYQREQGIIGALLTFGRAGLDAARAAGWSPDLCRRPQIRSLSAWLVDEIEAGRVVDLATAIDRLQLAPSTERDMPDIGIAIQILAVAPNVGPVSIADVAAHVGLVVGAYQADRLAELRVALDVAARAGDMTEVGRVAGRIAALTAGPRPQRAARTQVETEGDERPDPVVLAALKMIPKRARDDRRVRARVVLETDPRWQSLRFNAMTQKTERGGRLYTDTDDAATADWLSVVYGVQVPREVAAGIVDLVARRRSYDPLRDYLTAQQWDGVPRIDTWLQRGLGVLDSPLHRRLGACWIVSAVARALSPGCQVDTMLVFVGPQGRGKTRAVEALAGSQFFSETELRIGEIRGLQQLGDAWIHELGEMTPLLANRVDRNVFKNFLTTRTDKYQRLHAKRSGEYPRRCVFIGTVNDTQILTDPTGARRFWPVLAVQADLAWIRAERDQLWAEARMRYERGDAWHLTPPEEAELERLQLPFRRCDPWEEPLSAWLDMPERAQEADTSVTSTRLLTEVLLRPLGMQTQADKTRLGACMVAVGWIHSVCRDKTAKKTVNCYRPDPEKMEVQP